ncbi:intron encoded nuclease [Staphylococcus phage CF5]|uniref:Intron encoded nuclease n=1 Tax=Staphylococcus phage CF5 TaxID=3113739 RepID=A0AAX4J7D7_9CAUD|nr:intron encoded nuclease [Staphylococcus phage CF5]
MGIKELAKEKGIEIYDYEKEPQGKKYRGIVLEGKFKNCECAISYDNLKKLKKLRIVHLTDKGKKKYYSSYARSRGYEIIDYPEDLKATKRCLLLSPKGNKWDVIWNSFENNENNNCPQDHMKSIGERIIQTILKENDIEFVCEKSVYTGLNRPQRLDFYFEIDGIEYAIEYMGEQHIKQATGAWSKPLLEIQKLDERKKRYCEDNNIKLLCIYYPNEDKKEILNLISSFIDIRLDYTKGVELFTKFKDNEKEIIDFYKEHSAKETADKFNMSIGNVKGLMKRRGIKKRFKPVIGLNIKTLEEIKFDTLKEAQEHFSSLGLPSSSIRGCVVGSKKQSCGYLWRYENEDFSEVAKTITDKRIKVFRAIKGSEVIELPLHMLTKRINSDVATITNCAKGKLKYARGYTIQEVTGKEKEDTLKSISYIDYIQNYK